MNPERVEAAHGAGEGGRVDRRVRLAGDHLEQEIVAGAAAGVEHAPRWENAQTIAAGIRVPQAIGDFLILRAVRESGGFAMSVSDEAIATALEEVAREEGLLLSPEGAATWAACRRALSAGRISKNARVVLFNCATGLKYPLPPVKRALDRHKPIDYAQF